MPPPTITVWTHGWEGHGFFSPFRARSHHALINQSACHGTGCDSQSIPWVAAHRQAASGLPSPPPGDSPGFKPLAADGELGAGGGGIPFRSTQNLHQACGGGACVVRLASRICRLQEVTSNGTGAKPRWRRQTGCACGPRSTRAPPAADSRPKNQHRRRHDRFAQAFNAQPAQRVVTPAAVAPAEHQRPERGSCRQRTAARHVPQQLAVRLARQVERARRPGRDTSSGIAATHGWRTRRQRSAARIATSIMVEQAFPVSSRPSGGRARRRAHHLVHVNWLLWVVGRSGCSASRVVFARVVVVDQRARALR